MSMAISCQKQYDAVIHHPKATTFDLGQRVTESLDVDQDISEFSRCRCFQTNVSIILSVNVDVSTILSIKNYVT